MNLQILTDGELLDQTQAAAATEKSATLALLEHLLEIEKRGLALTQGFRSTWDYVHRGLGYSEAAASERVAAMRCLKRSPQVREMLRENKISFTLAAKVQHFVRAIEKLESRSVETDEMQILLERVAGRSKREAEKIFAEIAPAVAPLQARNVALDAEAAELLEKAKALCGAADEVETLKRALKDLVVKKEKELAVTPKREPTRPAASRSRYIPRSLKREVWNRANSKCEFVGPQGRCDSTHRLQIDHTQPLALGGETERQNLRLLCQGHNLAEARRMGLVEQSHAGNPTIDREFIAKFRQAQSDRMNHLS
jgi:5-methylcytosine-specific restriction endonuclease McrA